MTVRWDTRLELRLARPDAVRVLATRDLVRLATTERQDVSRATVERWILDAVRAGRLMKVVRGLYLNRMTFPPTELCEAAAFLRAGAVVSLQTVLGDAGAWNNYTSMATAIVPLATDRSTPSLGTVKAAAGDFLFRGMPVDILEAGSDADRLYGDVDYLRATPEAALLHWLYLANSPRSTLTPPPLEIDVAELSAARLRRLAKAMGLVDKLNSWQVRKRAYDQAISVDEQSSIY